MKIQYYKNGRLVTIEVEYLSIELTNLKKLGLSEADENTLQVENVTAKPNSKWVAALGMRLELVSDKAINLIPEG